MLFLSKEGELLNTDGNNPYFDIVKNVIKEWESDTEEFSFKSSGSTGKPKEIIFTRGQVLASVKTTEQAFGLNSQCLFFCCLNVEYVAGKMMIYRALAMGADLLVVEPSKNPLANLGRQELLLNKYRGRIFYAFAPLQLAEMIEDRVSADLLKLSKIILLGGAALSSKLNKVFLETNLNIFEGYGMTETLSHVAIRKLKDPQSTFKMIEGISFEINSLACLEINYPTLQSAAIVTNDLAKKVSVTSFKILGRADNIINSGGVKIQLEEVDAKIQASGKIRNRFFSFGLADEKYGQKLVLFIESEEKYHQEIDFKAFLSKFEVPKKLIFVKKFAETDTLKIDKLKTSNENA
jgi:o-succinylbenzoate---CoA ligase